MTIQQIQQIFGKPINEFAMQHQQQSHTKIVLTIAVYAFAVYGLFKVIESVRNATSDDLNTR